VSITFLHSRADRDDTPMDGRVELIMDGKPQGKARHRIGAGGHIYTPKPTRLAEARIIDAWIVAGRPRLEGRSISACRSSSPARRATTARTAPSRRRGRPSRARPAASPISTTP
jgi:hypothetical protein